jgi:hypothetical protein
MALNIAPSLQQAGSGSYLDTAFSTRDFPLSARNDLTRPVTSLYASPELDPLTLSPDTSNQNALIVRMRAQAAQTSSAPSWNAPDGTLTYSNPRGAPSDPTPALSKLEARIACEPVYLYHYASTRYAFISRLPTSLTDRREQIEFLV